MSACGLPLEFIGHRAPEFDFAAIELEGCDQHENPGVAAKTFGLKAHENPSGTDFRINGYPLDKYWGTQWWERARVESADGQRLTHRISTAAGDSGAPIHDVSDGTCGGTNGNCVVGIHTGHNETVDINTGIRLTEDVIDQLDEWKNAA